MSDVDSPSEPHTPGGASPDLQPVCILIWDVRVSRQRGTSCTHAHHRLLGYVLQAQSTHEAAGKAIPETHHPAKKAPGLLSHWLRRKEPQQPSTDTGSLIVKTEPTASAADPGTPTWSESSEASDFASIEAHSSPAAVAATSTGSYMDAQAMGQQPQARLAGRLGGWLTGVTSAAGQWDLQHSLLVMLTLVSS